MSVQLKTLKNISSLRTQKEIRQDHRKQQFFSVLMTKINESFTPEEHQFLVNCVLHSKHREKTCHGGLQQRSYVFQKGEEESPLEAIKDNIFRDDRKRKNKRMITLTDVFSDHPDLKNGSFATTIRKQKVHNRTYMNTTLTQKENQSPIINMARSCPKNEEGKGNPFKIYPIKRFKAPKGAEKMLKERGVLKFYNNNLISDIFETNTSSLQDEFSESYLLLNSKGNASTCEQFWQKQQEQDKKYNSINSIQFKRAVRRYKTTVKVSSRNF